MKTYYIFIAIAAISSIVVLGIPQLTGTVFVNNPEEKKPVDWLSAQVMKFSESPQEMSFDIPANIRMVRFQGSKKMKFENTAIFVKEDGSPRISHYSDKKVTFEVVADTLMVVPHGNNSSISLYMDSTVRHLVFDRLVSQVHINHTLPLNIAVENQSDIDLRGNRNTSLKQIDISGQSTFKLSHCFTPVIDMQVDNSMVYVERTNHVDSLKANLVGKSNIKRVYTAAIYVDEEILLKEFNVVNQHIFIYPTGNLEYYNLSKSH